MSGQKWVRSSLRSLSVRLTEAGHAVSPPTVGRLLQTLDYALHVNAKKIEASAAHPDRAAQFDYIAQQREAFTDAGLPIVSVDTKKKELIGTFKNAGRTWRQEGEAVGCPLGRMHDFRGQGLGRAVPYGIYDVTHNQGVVYVGSSGDTAQFAVEALVRWWQSTGETSFRASDHLLILADGGGSNGCRSRLWKQQLQERLCDELGLTVTVCHYPTGCSKWNPIEHRLFGPISLTWAGYPLRTWETMLTYISSTTTMTGLEVHAEQLDGHYETGLRVSDAQMATLQFTPHEVCPAWNYTLGPRSARAAPADLSPPQRELIV